MEDRDLRVLLARIMERQELDSEQIRELDGKVDKLLTEGVPGLRVEIAMLKVKSGLWGAAAGLLPVLVTLFIQYVSR